MVQQAIPNASLQHTWHVSFGLFLLFIFLTGTFCDHWQQEGETGHSDFVVDSEVLILVWCHRPLQHVAAASRRGCTGLSAVAQHAPLYLVPRKSIWPELLCPLSSARNKSLAVTNPASKYVCFNTFINFEEKEEKRRRGVFSLVFLVKYNQSRERILCFQPDIPSMCLAR